MDLQKQINCDMLKQEVLLKIEQREKHLKDLENEMMWAKADEEERQLAVLKMNMRRNCCYLFGQENKLRKIVDFTTALNELANKIQRKKAMESMSVPNNICESGRENSHLPIHKNTWIVEGRFIEAGESQNFDCQIEQAKKIELEHEINIQAAKETALRNKVTEMRDKVANLQTDIEFQEVEVRQLQATAAQSCSRMCRKMRPKKILMELIQKEMAFVSSVKSIMDGIDEDKLEDCVAQLEKLKSMLICEKDLQKQINCDMLKQEVLLNIEQREKHLKDLENEMMWAKVDDKERQLAVLKNTMRRNRYHISEQENSLLSIVDCKNGLTRALNELANEIQRKKAMESMSVPNNICESGRENSHLPIVAGSFIEAGESQNIDCQTEQAKKIQLEHEINMRAAKETSLRNKISEMRVYEANLQRDIDVQEVELRQLQATAAQSCSRMCRKMRPKKILMDLIQKEMALVSSAKIIMDGIDDNNLEDCVVQLEKLKSILICEKDLQKQINCDMLKQEVLLKIEQREKHLKDLENEMMWAKVDFEEQQLDVLEIAKRRCSCHIAGQENELQKIVDSKNSLTTALNELANEIQGKKAMESMSVPNNIYESGRENSHLPIHKNTWIVEGRFIEAGESQNIDCQTEQAKKIQLEHEINIEAAKETALRNKISEMRDKEDNLQRDIEFQEVEVRQLQATAEKSCSRMCCTKRPKKILMELIQKEMAFVSSVKSIMDGIDEDKLEDCVAQLEKLKSMLICVELEHPRPHITGQQENEN